MKKKSLIAVAAVAGTLLLAGCSESSMERFNDAPVSDENTGSAVVGTMPDGFSNFAAKCDGPNMVYVIYHGSSSYGSLDVVPNDPRCTD